MFCLLGNTANNGDVYGLLNSHGATVCFFIDDGRCPHPWRTKGSFHGHFYGRLLRIEGAPQDLDDKCLGAKRIYLFQASAEQLELLRPPLTLIGSGRVMRHKPVCQ